MFIAKAKLLPSNEQYDVVEGYIKVSIECVEIFKLLDGERRPESEVSVSVNETCHRLLLGILFMLLRMNT